MKKLNLVKGNCTYSDHMVMLYIDEFCGNRNCGCDYACHIGQGCNVDVSC